MQLAERPYRKFVKDCQRVRFDLARSAERRAADMLADCTVNLKKWRIQMQVRRSASSIPSFPPCAAHVPHSKRQCRLLRA